MAQWKPIIIDKKLISNGIEDLLGIEELKYPDSNSFLEKNIKQNVKKRKKKKKKSDCKIPLKKAKISKDNVTKPVSSFDENDLKFLNQMKSWGGFGIHNEIMYSLYKKKFFEPTKIQAKCLGPALSGQLDILGAAETGSGKTLAFGIPIVNGILSLKSREENKNNDNENTDADSEILSEEEDWENENFGVGCVKVRNLGVKKEKNKLYALVLTPTRELAVQVKDHLRVICEFTNIRVALVVGGLAHEKQERILNKRPEIVVATPGRLWELVGEKNIHLQDISKIRYLAIDETDRMLEKGHFAELTQLLEMINANENYKKKRQNFIFSATLTVVHDPPLYLRGKKRKRITPGQKLQELIKQIGVTNFKVIDITNSQVTAENLCEYKIFCKFEEKDYYLYHFLINHKGRTIIFCNSIGSVKRLANLLSILSIKPLPLHANMEQKQRLKNLEKFRDNDNSLLLATDVAARGLDIPNVEHVVHYQVPKTAETYVHRSGRTARSDNSGNALLLIEPQEQKFYTKLIHTLGRDEDIEELIVDLDTMNHIKKVVNLARDIDQLTLAMKKENSKTSWYSKAIKEMDIIVDEDDLPKKISSEAKTSAQKDLNQKKKQLSDLLKKSFFPKTFSGKFPDVNIEKHLPMTTVRRDKLKIPGAFVLKKVPKVL